MKKLGILLLSMAAFSASAVEKLALDLNLYLNNKLVKSQVIQAETDKVHTVVAEKILKFSVTPTLNGDVVTLTSTMYKFEDGLYTKFQEPRLETKLNLKATIEVGAENIQLYKVEVVAKKI